MTTTVTVRCPRALREWIGEYAAQLGVMKVQAVDRLLRTGHIAYLIRHRCEKAGDSEGVKACLDAMMGDIRTNVKVYGGLGAEYHRGHASFEEMDADTLAKTRGGYDPVTTSYSVDDDLAEAVTKHAVGVGRSIAWIFVHLVQTAIAVKVLAEKKGDSSERYYETLREIDETAIIFKHLEDGTLSFDLVR